MIKAQQKIRDAIDGLPTVPEVELALYATEYGGDKLYDIKGKYIKTIQTALHALEALCGDGGWKPIETAPSYDFRETGAQDYQIKAVCGDRVIKTLGHFKEDGFYLQDGGELSHSFTPILWMPLPGNNPAHAIAQQFMGGDDGE